MRKNVIGMLPSAEMIRKVTLLRHAPHPIHKAEACKVTQYCCGYLWQNIDFLLLAYIMERALLEQSNLTSIRALLQKGNACGRANSRKTMINYWILSFLCVYIKNTRENLVWRVNKLIWLENRLNYSIVLHSTLNTTTKLRLDCKRIRVTVLSWRNILFFARKCKTKNTR